MVDFKIRRGYSTQLFIESGVVNPKLVIEEGCWYLCVDTAELFLGVSSDTGLVLKRINGEYIPPDDTPTTDNDEAIRELAAQLDDLGLSIDNLQEDVLELKEAKYFKKIDTTTDLPDVNSEDFNPNVTYYLVQPDTQAVTTYIYDEVGKKYICITNRVDQETINISKAEINADGELIIVYSNGDLYNLGRVVGKDGKDGIVTSIKIGDKVYTHKEGVIELPEFITEADLSGYATEDFVRAAITAAELGNGDIDLSDYVTKEDLEGFASEKYVDEKIALIEHPELPSKIILLGGDSTPDVE